MNKMKTNRTYSLPAGLIDPEPQRQAAARRRQALTAGGCSTYVIGVRGGITAIICLCCGLGSTNVGDIEERYCGFCQTWHSDAKDDDQVNNHPSIST